MKKYLNWIKKNIFNEKEDDNKSEEKYREVTEKDTTLANNKDKISISHMDDLFWNAGKFIVENNKASIGMLQRAFQIGFNRAARIMDELCEAGIVGEAIGTTQRKILMSLEEFEELQHEGGIKVGEKKKSEQKEENTYITLSDVENMISNEIGIDTDYSNDGENLGHLKNFIVPSISDENQIEVINTLLKFNSPLTMRLLLMDDSIINYSIYNSVPHLLIPVVIEEKKFDATIHWCLSEMENRMKIFSENRVRNIDLFNQKMDNVGEEKCPRLIFVVNEASGFFKYVSTPLERLFLNSNMVGIHFILFSRLSLKALSLRGIKELLQPITAEQLCVLLSQSEKLYNKKIETKNFDDMDGYQFEKICAKILCENGFENVEVTQGSGDHGIDILAEKDDITYAIQCKCYSSDVGNAAIQQAYTGKGFYNKDIAAVMTNRYFTPHAIEEAKTLGVKLWDRNKLNEMIAGIQYKDIEKNYDINGDIANFSFLNGNRVEIFVICNSVISASNFYFSFFISLKDNYSEKIDFEVAVKFNDAVAICKIENGVEFFGGKEIDGEMTIGVPEWIDKGRNKLLNGDKEEFVKMVEIANGYLDDFMEIVIKSVLY